MSIKSADDLIVKREAEILGQKLPDAPKEAVNEGKEGKEGKETPHYEAPVDQESKHDQKLESEKGAENSRKNDLEAKERDESDESDGQNKQKENADTKNEASEQDIDEYGNKIGKKKVYTEEEVQRMIRERLSRGQFKEQSQATQTEMNKAVENFSVDESSSESWETQLEAFIENTLAKISHKREQAEWQQKEAKVQAEFESRFTNGMSRYDDFQEVVSGKPITNSMMMAARTMQDPAAFIYAASKNCPQELDRIARLNDPYAQMTEMGRLEERMRKARNLSQAPKPVSKISGDMVTNEPAKGNIDALIAAHAKTKVRR